MSDREALDEIIRMVRPAADSAWFDLPYASDADRVAHAVDAAILAAVHNGYLIVTDGAVERLQTVGVRRYPVNRATGRREPESNNAVADRPLAEGVAEGKRLAAKEIAEGLRIKLQLTENAADAAAHEEGERYAHHAGEVFALRDAITFAEEVGSTA